MNTSPHISCYFIVNSTVPEITLDGDTLRIPGVESYEGIMKKTLDALEYLLARNTYDFIIRTNISSIWDYPTLIAHLKTLPPTGVYAGLSGGIRGSMTWISGAGMILTPDVCKKLIDARELALSFNVIDDIDIGYTFQQLGIPITHGQRFDVYDDTSHIPAGFYHYRVRLLPAPDNAIRRTISCMCRIRDLMSVS